MMRGMRALFCVVLLLLPVPQTARAQGGGFGASLELVDPHAFRVCADPRNLPFSDEQGGGFENKIAELLASKLGEHVSYTFQPQVIGFYRNTLNAFRCDVVMGVSQGFDLVQTTNPYYHTTYALVFKAGSGLDGIRSLADQRLQDKRIGVIAGTPPATVMTHRGLMARAKPYPLTVDTRVEAPSKSMIDDILSGQIDAGVLWGPFAGYYARRAGSPLTVTPLLRENAEVPMDFRISMGVRHGDQEWKRKLNRLIADNQDAINKILEDYGVPLLDEQGNPIAQ